MSDEMKPFEPVGAVSLSGYTDPTEHEGWHILAESSPTEPVWVRIEELLAWRSRWLTRPWRPWVRGSATTQRMIVRGVGWGSFDMEGVDDDVRRETLYAWWWPRFLRRHP